VALTGAATQNDGAAETLPAPRLPVHTVAMQIAGPDQAPAQAEGQAADEADAETYKWPHKYVYFTCSGTFHLLDFGRRNGFGTAHYELCDHVHSCCCEHCEWWLAKLTKFNTTPYFFIYEASFGDPDTDYWAFARWPDCGFCKYGVWRHSKSCGWIRFGCGDRVTPK
jgi:hypothetical protein